MRHCGVFQLILESEMDKARNEQGIVGSEFQKPAGGGGSRPSSSMSNRSGQPNDVSEVQTLPLTLFQIDPYGRQVGHNLSLKSIYE